VAIDDGSACGFNVAGPKSRELLQRLTNAELSTESFPFMRSRRMTVGGIDVVALRVSFTGDLGWELYCSQDKQVAFTACSSRARVSWAADRSARAG
jgi:dimethylglycine dehydrogenase